MRRQKPITLGATMLLWMVVVSGCSSSTSELVPVSGKVTLDGDPVEAAVVVFEPEGGGPLASGFSDASGWFTLTCGDQGKGARIGMNRVSITKTKLAAAQSAEEEYDLDEAIQWLVPAKYANNQTSRITVEVKRGMDPVKLDLRSD